MSLVVSCFIDVAVVLSYLSVYLSNYIHVNCILYARDFVSI